MAVAAAGVAVVLAGVGWVAGTRFSAGSPGPTPVVGPGVVGGAVVTGGPGQQIDDEDDDSPHVRDVEDHDGPGGGDTADDTAEAEGHAR